jgi:hypothetical protein
MHDDERLIDSREMSIIKALNSHGVRYLIVGGYAMLFHGDKERPVNDLDIWIDRENDNANLSWKALNSIMPNCLNIQPDYLSNRNIKIDLRNNRYDIEIFNSMEGAEFNEAFSRCDKWEQDGELLYFVGARDLLVIKRDAQRRCPERAEKEANDISFLENLLHE